MSFKRRHLLQSLTSKLIDSEISELEIQTHGKINMALIFPGAYESAMSNLGFLTVHRLSAMVPGIGTERFFLSLDRDKRLAAPYYSFETARPLGDFDILAFSFSFEGDFDSIPTILGPLGIPVKSRDRLVGGFPLLAAGGAAIASNTDAVSEIFDILVPGEAETTWPGILTTFLHNGLHPEVVSELPGIWVPRLKCACNKIERNHDVSEFPAYSHLVTPKNVFGGASLIEVMRGCPRNCAFCLAREIYAPVRAVRADDFQKHIERFNADKAIGLIAPSLFDHPEINTMLELIARKKLRLKNSSVKWEKLDERILSNLRQCGVNGLTLAPEAGSERLRKAMRKPLREADFFDILTLIRSIGFDSVKFYFMLGLPDETYDDLQESVDLLNRIFMIPEMRGAKVSVSFAAFVPKKKTEWADKPFCDPIELKKRIDFLKLKLKSMKHHAKFNFENPFEAGRQAYLACVGPELADEYNREAGECRKKSTLYRSTKPYWDF